MQSTFFIPRFNSFAIVVLLALISSCHKTNNNTPAPDLKLGANYQGGIIFSLDPGGKHGLIAAAADLSKSTPWWSGTFVATGARSASDGLTNTNAIVSTQGNSGSYAAKICKDYRGGNYNDWFLPSKDQLNILYSQKALVGGFSDDIYWSSTEYDVGSAWVQYFLDGKQWLDNTSDGATVGTRAIRKF